MSIELLREYLDETKLSQSKVSAKLGFSTSVISQYLQGKYTGDIEAVDKAVVELVARHKEREQSVQSGFVETKTAKQMLAMCLAAHTTCGLYLIIGEAGIGKTMALKHFAEKVENAVLIEADCSFTPKALLLELCEALKINVTARDIHSLMKAVINKLSGSDKVLLIDEAELLSYKSLEILRRIHDKAQIGLVLAGMPRLRANLRGARGEFRQLFSRIDSAPDLPSTLPQDDIHLLSEAMLGTAEHNDQLYKSSKGNARRLSKLVRGVHRTSKVRGEPINAQMIERFAHTLID